MAPTEKTEINFAELSLESMDEKEVAATVPTGRATFHPNTRSKTDRRVLADRRQELRFKADRRSGLDRRPKKSWEPGSNL